MYSPSAPTRCLSPHMTAITFCDPPNLEAYDILARNVKTKLNLCTPIFFIHVLPGRPTPSAPCMQPQYAAQCSRNNCTRPHSLPLPLNDKYTIIFSQKKFQSIHDVRTLSTSWLPIKLSARDPTRHQILSSAREKIIQIPLQAWPVLQLHTRNRAAGRMQKS